VNLVIVAFVMGILGGGPGSTVLPLLKIGQGSRAAALGEAYVSVADDASAVYWNPAGLGRYPLNRLALSHHNWFLGIKDEVLHATFPTRGAGSYGLGLVYSGDPGIQYWDENNMPGDTFMTWSSVLNFGYGFRVADNYWLGATAKGMVENLRDLYGYGGGLDLGFIARPVRFLNVGLVARNVGAMMYGNRYWVLPAEVAAGVSGTLGRFSGTLDVVVPYDNDVNVRAGVECVPVSGLAVRVGYRTGPADLSTLTLASGLCAGLGVTVGNFDLDYAFTPYGKLGLAHRIGLATRFVRRGTSTIVLRVVSARYRDPVQADLVLSGITRASVVTDNAGEHVLRSLPAGLLVVRVSARGFVPLTETVHVRGLDRDQAASFVLQSVQDGGVWGMITDSVTGKPIGGRVSWEGPGSGSIEVDTMSGSFALKALTAGSYVVKAFGPTPAYLPQKCSLEVKPRALVQRDFKLALPPRAPVFSNVTFVSCRAEVLPEFDKAIEAVALAMIANPNLTIEIAGHADGFETRLGKFGTRQALSEARAKAVRNVLITKYKMNPERLTARGYGELKALAPSDTPENMALNRSVEFIVTRQ
jgi:outer membrane protein OmpA-like peptidoglycan-associated protein